MAKKTWEILKDWVSSQYGEFRYATTINKPGHDKLLRDVCKVVELAFEAVGVDASLKAEFWGKK